MGDRSSIEWTDATWNPTTGCDRVSPGCDHCYAMTLAKRLKAMNNPRYQNDGRALSSGPGFALTLHPDKLEEPRKWKTPRRVFVNSMSDLFHAAVPKSFISSVFRTMEATPQHTYQILTKRAARMTRIVAEIQPDPLPNVWLGVSVEDQRLADKRVPLLLETPAAIRFLSCEPLLDKVTLGRSLDEIDWVIAGGESGPGWRPLDVAWLRSLRDECLRYGVAFFLKQLGGHPDKRGGQKALLDRRTWRQWPDSTSGESDRAAFGERALRSLAG